MRMGLINKGAEYLLNANDFNYIPMKDVIESGMPPEVWVGSAHV